MTPTVPSPHPPRRRGWILYLLLLLIVVAGGGYYIWASYFRADDKAAHPFVTVQRSTVEDVVTATGTLQPRDYVDIGAQVSGVLTQIHVEVGSQVSTGELLAEIDPTVLQSRVDATRAQLRNLRAQLTDRESNLTLAQIQLTRQQNLMTEDATTEESLQIAQANLRSAHAQIEALKAQIDQTDSNLRADAANLAYSRIYAPMDGTVVSITARQGQTLNASQQAPVILRVADLSTMTVQTQVSEADVTRITPGMEVYFTTLGNSGQRWSSTLHKIEPTPTVTNNVVLYNALFDVPNPDRRLMTQMTAQVFFVTARANNALTVPMAALSGLRPIASANGKPRQDSEPARTTTPPAMTDDRASESDGASNGGTAGASPAPRQASVRILDEDGGLEERQVLIGVTSRVAAQVVSGVTEGERVVTGMRQPGASGGARTGSSAR